MLPIRKTKKTKKNENKAAPAVKKDVNLAINFSSNTTKSSNKRENVNEDVTVALQNPAGVSDKERVISNEEILHALHDFSTPKLPVSIRSRPGTVNFEMSPSHDHDNDLENSPNDGETKLDNMEYSNSCERETLQDRHSMETVLNLNQKVLPNYDVSRYMGNDESLAESISESFDEPHPVSDEADRYTEEEAVAENPLLTSVSSKVEIPKENPPSVQLLSMINQQQQQLEELQRQLQIFMEGQGKKNHSGSENRLLVSEKMNESENIDATHTETIPAANNTDVFNEVLERQQSQQRQMKDLQKQLQVLLLQADSVNQPLAPTHPRKLLDERNQVSIGTSTGQSLLWPQQNMASTNLVLSPRGLQQAAGMHVKSTETPPIARKRRKCSCCNHCKKNPAESSHQKQSANDKSALSEIGKDDLDSSLFNNSASSYSTIASSLQAVDLPMYDESQEERQDTPKSNPFSLADWEKSPQLGESASMLIEEQAKKQRPKQVVLEEAIKEDIIEEEAQQRMLLENQDEFYDQMMAQVQQMIASHASSLEQPPSQYEGEQPPSQYEGEPSTTAVHVVSEQVKSGESVDMENTPISLEHHLKPSREDIKKERVKEATNMQLQKIIQDTNILSGERPRSYSTGSVLAAAHPRLNYMSMSIEDSIDEHNMKQIETIAAKYLPKDLRLERNVQEMHTRTEEMRTRTVQFEGVKERAHSDAVIHVQNTMSVNISCNMSIASKKYLQRYQLVPSDQNKETEDGTANEVFTPPNILDMKKLRSLPKLV